MVSNTILTLPPILPPTPVEKYFPILSGGMHNLPVGEVAGWKKFLPRSQKLSEGVGHRIITYRMRAPISRQSKKCLHKMADL